MVTEPDRPALPPKNINAGTGDMGRIVTSGFIASDWHCRWCNSVLVQDGAAVICPSCDQSGVSLYADSQ